MSWGDNVHWNFHTYVMLRPPFFLPFRTNIMLRRCTFLAFTNASCYAAACIFYRTSTRASWYALYVFFCHTYVMPRRCTLWSFGALPHCRHAFPLFTLSLFQFHRCAMLCCRTCFLRLHPNVTPFCCTFFHFHKYVMLCCCMFSCISFGVGFLAVLGQ